MNITLTVLGIGLVLAVLTIITIFMLFFRPYMPFFNGAKVINNALSNQYYYQDGNVIHAFGGTFYSLGASVITEADPESFEVLAYNYAKDNTHVFYQGLFIEDADPKSFELLAHEPRDYNDEYPFYTFAKDDKNAFYLSEKIDKADITSFTHLWGSFSSDASSIFFEENIIAQHSETPQRIKNDIQEYYLRTGDKVYYHAQLLDGVDAQSFQVIQGEYAKDKYHVYKKDILCEGIHADSFEIINPSFQRDSLHLYYDSKRIDGADADSYEYINDTFSKDKNQVYYLSWILMDIDSEGFSLKKAKTLDNDTSLSLLHYDDSHIFYAKKADIETKLNFLQIYKENVYANSQRLIGADPKDIRIVDEKDPWYLQSAGKTYYYNNEIIGADYDSFNVINMQFAKDKNHVYYAEFRLLDISPEDFVYTQDIQVNTVDEYTARLQKL